MKLSAKKKADFKRLVAKTKKNAWNTGKTWSDEDVAYVMHGIEHDDTTYNIAMGIGRSYYSIQTARAHIRFALDHSDVLYGNVTPIRKVSSNGHG